MSFCGVMVQVMVTRATTALAHTGPRADEFHPSPMKLLGLLDELRVLARNGLRYAENDYDRGRYERMLELVSQAYASSLGLPAAEVQRRFVEELGHVTPKIGADVAVFDTEDRLLLVRRSDDGRC